MFCIFHGCGCARGWLVGGTSEGTCNFMAMPACTICQPSHLSAKRLKQRNGNEKMIGLPIWCYEWPKTARERLGEKVISRENRIRSNTPFLQEKCCQFTDRWRTVAVTCESFLCILCLFVCFCLFVFFLFLLFPGTSTVLSSFTSYWQAASRLGIVHLQHVLPRRHGHLLGVHGLSFRHISCGGFPATLSVVVPSLERTLAIKPGLRRGGWLE